MPNSRAMGKEERTGDELKRLTTRLPPGVEYLLLTGG